MNISEYQHIYKIEIYIINKRTFYLVIKRNGKDFYEQHIKNTSIARFLIDAITYRYPNTIVEYKQQQKGDENVRNK